MHLFLLEHVQLVDIYILKHIEFEAIYARTYRTSGYLY